MDERLEAENEARKESISWSGIKYCAGYSVEVDDCI